MLSLLAQVAIVVTMNGGAATTVVQNPSRETQHIELGLFYGHIAEQSDHVQYVELDEAVDALVAPASFTLAPGEQQIVRLKLRKPVPTGTVLRLVTTFTPVESTEGEATIATIHLTTITRFIGKVVVGP